MAANIEEFTSSISQIASNADKVTANVTESGRRAIAGAELVDRIHQEMQEVATAVGRSADQVSELDRRSAQIESVVTVIREIAEQTNLLALNAAIEAARAGETGRGFAVVADEVRKLAERTSTSTTAIAATIKEMQQATQGIVVTIGEGVERVRGSYQLSETTAAAMREISASTLSATQQVQEISRAIQEQRANAEDIAQHIESVSQGADANAQVAEQVAMASKDLNQIAGAIENDVGFFKLANETRGASGVELF